VLELAPRHALAHYNLALVFSRVDRTQEALDELQRALAIEPRPEAHYTMGVIYWHQNDLDRAAGALRAAVAAAPADADAHYMLGVVLKTRHEWAIAAASLRRAIALRTDSSAAHYTLGQVLQITGDETGAREHLVEADRLRQAAKLEQEASVWTVVGTQKLDAGDLAGAIDHFRRATAIFEAYAPAHYQMGRALEQLGQHDASRAAFSRAQQLNPSLLPPPDRRF
jgi:tetratricopeptide (TPR) repeat protein